MTAKYFAILTNQGAARLANAAALGTRLNLTQMAVGDANGTLPTPDPAQTKLINQKRIAPLNLLTVDPANTSQIIAEQIIPENEGGFWIREIGLYDDDGILIAVANCPETYKPELQEGSGRTQTIRMILIVSSTSAITLKIDPSVVLATRQYVDDKVIEVKSYADGLMRAHEQSRNHPDATTTAKGFTQLNSSVTDDRETQSATPKAVKIAMDNANARLAKERNLSDLPNPALARQNLQLGDSSTKNTGTTANTVAAGDDARITGAMQKSQNGADIQDVAKFLQNLGLGDVLHAGTGRLLAGTYVSSAVDATSIGVRAASGCQFMRAHKAPDAPDQNNYWQVIVLPETTESNGRVSCLAMSGNDIHLGNGDASGISTWTILSGRQPASDTLTALSGLATGANQLPYFTGIGKVSQTPLTQMGRDIIGLTSVADALSYLGISSNLVPVGVPLPWPLAAPPSGWLLCNGQTFTAEQYPALAVAYPGLATPDLRGLFIRGLDNGRGYDPFRGLGTEQIDAFASHRHQPDQTTVGNRFVADYSESGSGSGAQITMGSNNYAMCRYTNYVGGTETRPRNFALNYIVRAA